MPQGPVAIELLAAAQGIDFRAPLVSSPILESVRRRLRQQLPKLGQDRFLAPDIAFAEALVRNGTVTQSVGRALDGVDLETDSQCRRPSLPDQGCIIGADRTSLSLDSPCLSVKQAGRHVEKACHARIENAPRRPARPHHGAAVGRHSGGRADIRMRPGNGDGS